MIQKFILLMGLFFFCQVCGRQTPEGQAVKIVSRHIEAIGGLARLREVESMKMTGQFFLNGRELPLTIFRKRPNLLRIESDINGRKVIVGYDGFIAWVMRGDEAIEIEDLRAITFLERSADFDGALVDYKAKGHQIKFKGKHEVDGIETYLLEVTIKNGKVENWYLNSQDFTVLKRTFEMPHPYDPNLGNIHQVFFYLDYKEVYGVLIPHYMEREDMQYIREYQVLEVEINPELPDGLFVFSS